jgi:prepilin-type N-terminal cleavage/methylation domain-containing protein
MRSRRGFTLVELMIVVSIVCVLASIAIPLFSSFRFRARNSEATLNLRFLATLETGYASSHDAFAAARPSPPSEPGQWAQEWVDAGDFEALGWRPEGTLYFQYAIATNSANTSFAAAARSDLDGDGQYQLFCTGRSLSVGASPAVCPFDESITGSPSIEPLTPGKY